MRSLQTRAQFEAVLKAQVVARSEHFALHRLLLSPPGGAAFVKRQVAASGALASASNPSPMTPQAVFPPGTPSVSIESGPDGQDLAFGVLVPKRWAPRAVTRNLIKRQARDLARHSLAGQAGALYLLRLRKQWGASYRAARSPVLAREVRRQIQEVFQACPA